MARYNEAFSITFNDNDGGVGWSCNPECADDVQRYVKIFGLWRARWIFFKRFWIALRWMENYQRSTDMRRLWIFNAEIPE
jgi:hypothetical protein